MQPKIAVAVFALISLTSAHRHVNGRENGQARYRFDYRVNDPQTHDVKSQREERNGQHVTGEYSLREADGTTRIVRYRAGPHTGFEAEVERQGEARYPSQYGQSHNYGGFAEGNFGAQSQYHGQHDHGYNHGRGNGGNGGTSHVGTIRWRNQGQNHY